MSDGMVFCRTCGGTMHSSAAACPNCGAPQAAAGGGDGIERTFSNAIAISLRKYVDFSGRAPRAEYWWFVLFSVLLQVAIGVLERIPGIGFIFGIVAILASLALLLPSIAVGVRRLHDIDRSGWWALLSLIPVVGWIIVLIWVCTRGTGGPNRFGPENGVTA
jgi:uncharacterized membrane protein YhaH (DUF805 family)